MPRLERLAAGLLLGLLVACASGGGSEKAAPAKRLSAQGRTNLGLAQNYLAAGQVKQATQRAELALASDPGAADVHALFGLIHSRNGDRDKAARSMQRALALAPNDGSILNVHASWLCEQKQYLEADAQFRRALRDPAYRSRVQGLANAGKCAHQAGNWAQADAHLRQALAIAPGEPAILYLLADTELRLGRLMEAQAFIQRRDALGPDAQTLELAAAIEDAAGNAHAAARYRQRLKDAFPDHVPTGEGARMP